MINEERGNETKIIAMNANGFPSNKANKYKLKQINGLLKENDILVALETGINDTCKPRNVSDNHHVTTLNHQDKKGKDQY